MIPYTPLQTLDLSQYLFEEFCHKWAFYLYEKAISKKFNGDYDLFWNEFNQIKPNIFITYRCTTILGTHVTFYNDDKNGGWFTFKVKQIEQTK